LREIGEVLEADASDKFRQ
jgi:hypothetical protein